MGEGKLIGIFIALVVVTVMLLTAIAYDPPPPPPGEPIPNYPFEEVDPGDYGGLTYSTPAAALYRANTVLGDISNGEVEMIDTEDPVLNVTLVLHRSFGDQILWEISDCDTIVRLDPYTGEILMYFNSVYEDGALNEGEILALADVVAGEFAAVPNDADDPTAVHENLWGNDVYNNVTDDWSSSNYMLWTVRYDRLKDDIQTTDSIILNINGGGSVLSYTKNWNMDLDDPFTADYEIDQQEAEEIATAGDPNSTVRDIYQEIVRPNNYWSSDNEVLVFNSTERAVWTVWVERVDYHPGALYIFHIDAETGDIVGGDMGEAYYV